MALSGPILNVVASAKRNWIYIVISFLIFLVIILTDFGLFNFWDSDSYISAILLGIVGFLFIFSKSWFNKIVMGVIPLLMAITSLPFLADVSFIGWFGPGIFRSIILLAIFFYYFFFGYKQENRESYKQMAIDSGKTGIAIAKKGSPMLKFLLFAVITAGIYLLESYLDILGLVITGIALLIIAVLLFFGKGLVSKLLGLISFAIALPNIAEFIPGMKDLLDIILFNSYLGFESWTRYILVVIVAFYLQFRKKAWAQKNVQQI